MGKIKYLFAILVLSGVPFLGGTGCGSSPAGPAPVSIVWAYPTISHYLGGQFAFVQLRVDNQPLTNAAVTLSGTFTGAPVVLPYSNYVTHGSVVYANYETTTFTYEPNKVYTLSTKAKGKTASGSVTAPGGISVLTNAGGAVTQASWTYDGSADNVDVYENSPTSQATFNTLNSVSDATSPVAIPDNGGSNAYPDGSGSSYSTTTVVKNVTTTISGGTLRSGSTLYADDYLISNVTLP